MFVYHFKCISLSMMLLIVGELKFAAWINQSPHFLYDPLLSVTTTGFKWIGRELIKQTWIILLWWRNKCSKLDSEVPWPEKLKFSNNYSVPICTNQKWRGERREWQQPLDGDQGLLIVLYISTAFVVLYRDLYAYSSLLLRFLLEAFVTACLVVIYILFAAANV